MVCSAWAMSQHLKCLSVLPLVASASWSLIHSTSRPAARSWHAGAWDVASRQLWVHGGSSMEAVFDDLWILNVDSGGLWLQLSNDAGPTPREDHAAVWGGTALWLHGGRTEEGGFAQDLWRFSAGAWTRWTSSLGRPAARSGHVAIWDDVNDLLWIHGGYSGDYADLHHDLWSFDPSSSNTSAWRSPMVRRDLPQPSGRAYHAAAWVPETESLWIHGGYDGSLCGDLWSFHLGSSSWQLLSQSGPAPRAEHVAAWETSSDEADLGRLWVHGGFGEDAGALGDLWFYRATRSDSSSSRGWQLLEPSGPRRYQHVALFDVANRSFWVHGGRLEMQDQGDTWRFDLGDGDSIGGNGHATDQPTSRTSTTTRVFTTRTSTTSTTSTSSSSVTGTRTSTSSSSNSWGAWSGTGDMTVVWMVASGAAGLLVLSLSFYLFGCGCCRSQKPTIFPLNEQRLWEPAGPLLLPKRPFLAEDADPEDPAPRHEHSVRVAITLAVSDGDHGWWPIPLQLRRRNTRRHLMDGYWRSFGHGGLPALVALPRCGPPKQPQDMPLPPLALPPAPAAPAMHRAPAPAAPPIPAPRGALRRPAPRRAVAEGSPSIEGPDLRTFGLRTVELLRFLPGPVREVDTPFRTVGPQLPAPPWPGWPGQRPERTRRWAEEDGARGARRLPPMPPTPRSQGELPSTLGGPWWTAGHRRQTNPYSPRWTGLRRGGPGPASYEPELSNVYGRIPGRRPGFPQESWR